VQQQIGAQPEFKIEGGHLTMSHTEKTGLPKVKDASVNDRDRMQDLLAQEKYLTNGYNLAMIEASHDALFQTSKQNFEVCHQAQRQLFNLMFKKGWYKLPVAKAEAVSHAFKQFAQYKSQFPFPPGPEVANMTSGQQSGQGGGQTPGQQVGQVVDTVAQRVGQAMQRIEQTGEQLAQQMGMNTGRTH